MTEEPGSGVPGDAPEPGTGQPGGRRGPGTAAQRGLARAGYIEYDRVLFFSDAVFAIAVTLLAVDLRVPAGSGPFNTARALQQAVPRLTGFAISFAVIALFWLGHHGIFRHIVALDRPLMAINLVFLGTIALLPYPTSLLSRAGNTTSAVVFYAACAAAAGIAEGAVWFYATRPAAGLAGPLAGGVRRRYVLRIGRIPVIFLASVPVALVAPGLAPYVWVLIWMLGIVIDRSFPGE